MYTKLSRLFLDSTERPCVISLGRPGLCYEPKSSDYGYIATGFLLGLLAG